jgi:D-galactarolactone isomerase
VLPDAVTEAELRRLHAQGVRGVRFMILPGAGGLLPWHALPAMAARIAPLGWHINLQLDGRELPQHRALIDALPCAVVIDHTGKFLEPVLPSDPAFKLLLGLVEEGHTYVKLSAPYEVSKVGPPHYGDVGALAKELVKAAPDRMLWASNWPHPTPNGPRPDEAVLLDVLLDWVPDEGVRQKVLVDNPARVYGY